MCQVLGEFLNGAPAVIAEGTQITRETTMSIASFMTSCLPPGRMHTKDYLSKLGVSDLPPLTSPYDSGYDPVTLQSHLDQSSHLISMLKLSMSCWIIANESATRKKFAAAEAHHIPTVTGGGPFEVAMAQDQLPAYLDLCSDMGASRIECTEGLTELNVGSRDIVKRANARGLEVQFELGRRRAHAFEANVVDRLLDQGYSWLDAGAVQLVIASRESSIGLGLFDEQGRLNASFADRLAGAFGLSTVIFAAPGKSAQFRLLEHFGPEVQLCNVRLEELLRVEIFRRGLHADAFGIVKLNLARVRSATTSRR